MQDNLKSFIEVRFGVTTEVFLQALRSSPSANGYITGAISELLLKNYLESLGYEVLRIKENPQEATTLKTAKQEAISTFAKKAKLKINGWLLNAKD
ncbi:MAG: hypothetical protein EAZ97_05600 [Bacteroidetes bacterium]|nr:MAG: hypothetical protein EAZ97_05600 [Bacteroidota bacterium]